MTQTLSVYHCRLCKDHLIDSDVGLYCNNPQCEGYKIILEGGE